MEANELRIGNYVFKTLYNGKKILWDIDFMDLHPQIVMDYTPIPLTEEWLLKCEHIKESVFFDGNENKGFYLGEDEILTVVSFTDGIFLYTMKDDESWGYVDSKIEFVHELQNIFYWFNNQKKELKLKSQS